MNVVLFNDHAHVNGGASKIALASAESLANAGHRVFVVCAVGPVGRELAGHPNISVHCTGQHELLSDPNRLRAATQGLWNPVAGTMVRNLLHTLDQGETVVHIHTWAKALSSSVVREAVDRGFEVVLTVHDFLLACPTGTLFLHPTQHKCHIEPMSLACVATNCDARSYGQKLWRVGRHIVQEHLGRFPKGVGHYIFFSELAERLMRPYLPSGAAIHHVPNFVDTPYSTPAPVSANHSFYFLGRLVAEKGATLFAGAARDAEVESVFVGEGEKRASVLAENPNSRMLGWLSHAEGLDALRSARALVFPSLWYETMGLVVSEAAAHGVPSIVPDSSAARESVIDGVTGLHFRCGDRHDLAAKIRMLKDPELAALLGAAAHRRFWSLTELTLKSHTLGLERVYTQMLRSDGRHAASAVEVLR